MAKSGTAEDLRRYLADWNNRIVGLQSDLLRGGKELIAVRNANLVADNLALIGLIDWRRGKDPRPEFEKAVTARLEFIKLAAEYNVDSRLYARSTLLAVCFLMGAEMDPSEEDGGYYEMNRWPLYTSCVVHALYGKELDERRRRLLASYLNRYDGLWDRSVKNYLTIAGASASGEEVEKLVADGCRDWERRKSNKSFSSGNIENGYGEYNAWFIDILLAASMKKAGLAGGGLHQWKWG